MRIAQSAADSSTGRKRRHNEDSYVAAPPMFAVADGMGGAQAGELASSLAAETVAQGLIDPAARGEERVVALIKAANRRVHQRATDDRSASGMGTTMTVALLQPDGTVAIGHVGDSRAYRLRDGLLEQLTDDHSLVAELVRRGELSPEEAAVHPQRSVITRALGTEADVDVDAFTVEARDGDLFLLCSDGLTTMVDVPTITAILGRHLSSLTTATKALIRAANDEGGDDNITAILFSVAEDADDDDLTVELAVPAPADPDDEDTLHPEDRVMPPQFEAGQHEAAGLAAPQPTAPQRDVTMILTAAEIANAVSGERGSEVIPAERASTARLVIAVLVIIALLVAILALVLEALPR